MTGNIDLHFESNFLTIRKITVKQNDEDNRPSIHITISPSRTLNPKISSNGILKYLEGMDMNYENVESDLFEHRWTILIIFGQI